MAVSTRRRATAAPAPVSSWREELGLPDDADFLTRIIRLNLLVSSGLESVVEAFGIGVGDYLVLSTVRRSPGGRNAPTQLCRVLGRTTGGMTLTLDRLEANGLSGACPTPPTGAGSSWPSRPRVAGWPPG